MMSNREHLDAIGQFLEHDVIRESNDGQPPRSPGRIGNASALGGRGLDQFKNSLYLVNEPIRGLRTPFPVPSAGVAQLLPRRGLDEYRLQRSSTLTRISSSTARQSSPRCSTASCDRRSISAAHARCTSSSDASILASSSAARIARSSGSSSSACRKTRFVASVMGLILPQGVSENGDVVTSGFTLLSLAKSRSMRDHSPRSGDHGSRFRLRDLCAGASGQLSERDPVFGSAYLICRRRSTSLFSYRS
jgi:hypothetical protein